MVSERLARFRLVSAVFSVLHLPSRYGDETLNTPASLLFTRLEANAYLSNAEEVLEACDQLLKELDN